VTVYCQAQELNENGMIIDFTEIKEKIHSVLDHTCLNNDLDFNPTAENIAYWICMKIESCYRVDVRESRDNVATYCVDGVI